jgi:hypothetical protein
LFSLDAFEEGVSVAKQLTAFVVHLIPTFVLRLEMG